MSAEDSPLHRYTEVERADIARSFLHAFECVYNTVPVEKLLTQDNNEGVEIYSEAHITSTLTIELSKSIPASTEPAIEELENENERVKVTEVWGIALKTLRYDAEAYPYWDVTRLVIEVPDGNVEQARDGVQMNFSQETLFAESSSQETDLDGSDESSEELPEGMQQLLDELKAHPLSPDEIQRHHEQARQRLSDYLATDIMAYNETGYGVDEMNPKTHNDLMELLSFVLDHPPHWQKLHS